MSIVIKIENLSKQYRLGLVSTRTLSHDLNRWWTMNIRGKEDPYLKIGETAQGTEHRAQSDLGNVSETRVEQKSPITNHKSQIANISFRPAPRALRSEPSSDYIWALRDINLEVEQGDVLGIIGKNGAGKSTLLKILSKVTAPTTGTVCARGRIASLLEVGTGFHPEMTGRENIYMNGAIMGMSKTEITRKLDEIIDFAGVERYIDTPVKRYSSGMTVRLGFAVAAHLEPEILVVDEVLTVGDAEFQKKAIGKMQDISKGEGRTVLFVSHNMNAVNDLCNYGILISDGQIVAGGSIKEVIVKYLSISANLNSEYVNHTKDAIGNETIKIRKAFFVNTQNERITFADINEEIGLYIEYEVLCEIKNFNLSINVYNCLNDHLFTSHDNYNSSLIDKRPTGLYKTLIWIPADLFQEGTIEFSFACIRYNPLDILFHEKLLKIEYLDPINTTTRNENWKGKLPGLIRPKVKWEKLL